MARQTQGSREEELLEEKKIAVAPAVGMMTVR